MKAITIAVLLAIAGIAQADEVRESWVLIISPKDQPMVYVPGFTSERTCEQAIIKLQKSQNLFLKAVCVRQ